MTAKLPQPSAAEPRKTGWCMAPAEPYCIQFSPVSIPHQRHAMTPPVAVAVDAAAAADATITFLDPAPSIHFHCHSSFLGTCLSFFPSFLFLFPL